MNEISDEDVPGQLQELAKMYSFAICLNFVVSSSFVSLMPSVLVCSCYVETKFFIGFLVFLVRKDLRGTGSSFDLIMNDTTAVLSLWF